MWALGPSLILGVIFRTKALKVVSIHFVNRNFLKPISSDILNLEDDSGLARILLLRRHLKPFKLYIIKQAIFIHYAGLKSYISNIVSINSISRVIGISQANFRVRLRNL